MPTIGEKNCGAAQEKRDDTGGAGVAARHIGTVGFQMGNRGDMPDILLLPILADVFGVQIDALFRERG